MKKIITFLLVAGITLTSCTSTESVMKGILKNLQETDINIQKLLSELNEENIDISKIEEIASTGEELAKERELLIDKYQDAYYKKEKGLHIRLDGFSVTVKKDNNYEEYLALQEQIKSSCTLAGESCRMAIFTDLNDQGGKVQAILNKGSGKFGTVRDIYDWYFFNSFDDEIDELSNDVLKISDTNGKLQLIEEYIESNPWLISIAKDFEKLYEYRNDSKNQYWRATNETLRIMSGIGGSFSDILAPNEIRDAIILNI